MSFAQRLSELMASRTLTNYQLAKDLDIHPTTVANWLAGKAPRKKTLALLAEYFGVSTDYLLGNERKEEPTADSSELDKELKGIDFALYGEVKELTDGQKQDVLDFIRFKKAQDQNRGK